MPPIMKPLKDFADYGFLRLWVSSVSYPELVVMVQTTGFAATIPTVRRRLRVVLKHRGWLTPGQKPTPEDYARIKRAIVDEWRNEDLV